MTAATDPPVRGDHRSTWLALIVVGVFFLSAVVAAMFVATAYTP